MSNNDKQLYKKLKQQRVFIAILVICIPITGWFSSQYFGTNLVTKTKFSMLDPLRKFIPAESYITNIQPLRDYLQGLGTQYPDSISIYYENINSGASIAVNKELALLPASLSKLVQAIIITKKVEDGTLAWNKELKAETADLSSGSGMLYKAIGDKKVTVDKLLEELLVNSDNTAQNIFRRHLTVDDYIKFQYETGLQDLYNDKGFISAKEYTRTPRVLYTSSFLEPENSEKILNLMSESKFKDYLSQGIPPLIKFAHKYGENVEFSIFADSGIVYVPGKPYMISVIIKGEDSTLKTRAWAVNLMKEISERAYNISK